jgi:TonB family protein
MKFAIFVSLILSLATGRAAVAADDPIETAKTLYLSAAYQEALTALSNLPAGSDLDAADKYRALCFLGLDKPEEAGRALEALVKRRPLYTLDTATESPKLVAVFEQTRTRTLPDLVRKMFASAKEAFEKHELAAASAQFAEVVMLLESRELAKVPALADMRLLADGFAKLTDHQRIAAEKAAAVAAATTARATNAPAIPEPPKVYTAEDGDVVAPMPVSQTMPLWSPPNDSFRRVAFSGTLEVVIDENGAVESARMAQATNPGYDQQLIAATKNWRYTPATTGGRKVKYRKLIKITLQPTGTSGGSAPLPPAVQ